MKTYTVFIQEAETPTTTFITAVEAPDQEVAANLALTECIEAWGDSYTRADLHILGIAAGDVEILEWEDQIP
jgi:hypothetical protein